MCYPFVFSFQDHEEFASHRMNKDVWSNETILTLLRGNFVFWQRNKTLRQARHVSCVVTLILHKGFGVGAPFRHNRGRVSPAFSFDASCEPTYPYNCWLIYFRYYIEKYNLDGEVLPHTAILDPRTGTQLLKVVGYVEAQVLSMAIVEFLESNSIDQVSIPDSVGSDNSLCLKGLLSLLT